MNRVITTVAAIVLTATGLEGQSPGQKAAHAYRESHGPEILHSYVALLSMPNVASDSADIWRNAIYIRDRFRERGVNAELLTQPGAPPIVYGELKVPGATRTLGIYAHYDGQPVDSTRWTHAPWSPTLYTRAMEAGGKARPLPSAGEAVDPEWRLYGRSSGDDKAPIGAMLAVLDAYRAAGIHPTSNIKFFLDGEEEAGSPHMAEYLKQYRDRIDDIDIWLFCDGPVHQSGRP
ncbi:MAG: M20/M25/M40 family metallo-hydrolase, partial [Gemmatimonadota bacterium]